MKTKESIILAAQHLTPYEQKQIAIALIANTLTPMAITEVTSITNQIAKNKSVRLYETGSYD